MAAQLEMTAHRVAVPRAFQACALGESPMWDDANKVLWWIDILDEAIHIGSCTASDPLQMDSIAVVPLAGHNPGFVVQMESGNDGEALQPRDATSGAALTAVFGSQSGLYRLRLPRGVSWITDAATKQSQLGTHGECDLLAPFPLGLFPLQGGRVYRFNDGKVSPTGVLWTGGMMEKSSAYPKRDDRSGTLLVYSRRKESTEPFEVAVSGVTISNGIGWSPQGDVLYHIDTASKVVRAYRTVATGLDGAGEVYWKLPEEYQRIGGTLDGLCVDASGAVWVALAGMGKVVRLQCDRSQSGDAVALTGAHVTGMITVPGVTLCTSCCFGGPNLDILYITTARGTSREAVESCTQEDAGYLFAVNLAGIARGLASTKMQPQSVGAHQRSSM